MDYFLDPSTGRYFAEVPPEDDDNVAFDQYDLVVGFQTFRGKDLCVAVSRAILFLTVPGPLCFCLMTCCMKGFNSMDDVLKTVALYALIYLYIYLCLSLKLCIFYLFSRIR